MTHLGGPSGGGTAFKLAPPAKGATAWTETVIFNFSNSAGFGPFGGFIADAYGNLYSTTAQGGAFGDGTVFMLSPPAAGKTAWSQSVLFSFNGSTGSGPQAGLISDFSGNLYGTTCNGGTVGTGAVFKLTKPTSAKARWTETVVYSFGGADGSCMDGGVIADASGSLYGTNYFGGTSGYGTAFKLTP
jgi:uncharacterized repeat protein (TIGR03803 family)